MGRTKKLGLIVGVVTTALVAVGTRVRAIKTASNGSDPVVSQSSSQKQVADTKAIPNKPKMKPETSASGSTVASAPAVATVLWREDFKSYSTTSINTKFWNVADKNLPIYNDEQQRYDSNPTNVRIEGGNLVLEARNTGSGITSGRVDTKGKVMISQGSRLEARIKLPKGKGVWPAFWLLSDSQPHTTPMNPTDADWNADRFYMHDGEIDIMESYGSYPGVVEATLHTFSQSYEQQTTLQDEDFHTYWMEWSANKIVMGVDDRTISTYSANPSPLIWPFTSNNQMYVILNLAMGGTGGGPIVTAPGDNWRMEVESIAVSKL